METVVRFTVHGTARPQGNKHHVGNGRMVEDKNLYSWRADVASRAAEAYGSKDLWPKHCAVEMRATFWFPRPTGHYGSGRNANKLKPSALAWPTTRADLEKLERAIGDALTGVVLQDDSSICSNRNRKRWGSPARVEVELLALAPDVGDAQRGEGE